MYKREYCRDHLGRRACRWCFTFIKYTGMKLPAPSYSITVGKDKVTVHGKHCNASGDRLGADRIG